MENIDDNSLKKGNIMGKPVIDNCTIYRLLDGMDADTQRRLCSNALKSYQEYQRETFEEKDQLKNNLLDLLKENNLREISDTIIEIILNQDQERQIKNELLIVLKRMEYLDGSITLEEMQSFIHDTLLDDEYYLYQVEYQCLLYHLLKKSPEEYDIGFIEEIRKQKMNAMKIKQNPTCNYPN